MWAKRLSQLGATLTRHKRGIIIIRPSSEKAGSRVAAILSIIGTCRRLKIPVRDYLGSVLPGLRNP